MFIWFSKRGWKSCKENILKHAHQRELISHLNADVVAHDAVNQVHVAHLFSNLRVLNLRGLQPVEESIVNVVEPAVGHDYDLVSGLRLFRYVSGNFVG